MELRERPKRSEPKPEPKPERIVNQRLRNGKIEFLVKYNDVRHKIWIPKEKLNKHRAMVKEFMGNNPSPDAPRPVVKAKPKPTDQRPSTSQRNDDAPRMDTIGPEMEAEMVIGSLALEMQDHYLVKWRGVERAHFVPANECKRVIPDLVTVFEGKMGKWNKRQF